MPQETIDTQPPTDLAPAVPSRFQINITMGLVFGFGGLVLLAVVTVLALGMWSARENTLDLLRDKSAATIELIVGRIAQHLRPAEEQLSHIGRQIESGAIDHTVDADLGKYLSGALAATPQVRSVVFIRDDLKMVFALRTEDGVNHQVLDISKMSVIRDGFEEGRGRAGLYWAEVIKPETADVTLINARYAVHHGGRYLGLLAATVRIDRLSALLAETASRLDGSAFVLYDDNFVLAHPRLVDTPFPTTAAQPMPTLAEVADPVLQALTEPQRAVGRVARLAGSTGFNVIDVGGNSVALLSRRLTTYGDAPWLAGVYFPAARITDELLRLRWAAIAGLLVLLLALVAAYAFARYLSTPLNRLAGAAQQVRDLSLSRVPRLPISLFTEITDSAQAFNSMVTALRWFETYVPRYLVRRLVRYGESAVQESVTREATVIFTDIAGFTSQSEAMTAGETAAFLNHHFAVLSSCIEDESGTIDKFIGDAVMAFWGAPESQPNHAARACRAALAIRAAVEADNADATPLGTPPVEVRIGLHSGEVIVGNIGAPGRINYTIVGDTVNTANRLEQLAKEVGRTGSAVTILLSGTTAQAAGATIVAKEAGRHPIRGRHGELDVFYL